MPNTEVSLLEVKGMQMAALLERLEDDFPPLNPHPENTHAQIMYRAGQRSVVEYIKHHMDED
jgi:hypothetical protein